MYNYFEEVDAMEEILLETLGEKEFLESIILALDVDTKKEIYEFIARMNDIHEINY